MLNFSVRLKILFGSGKMHPRTLDFEQPCDSMYMLSYQNRHRGLPPTGFTAKFIGSSIGAIFLVFWSGLY